MYTEANLTSIPRELLLSHISKHITPRDLCHLAQVSRAANILIEGCWSSQTLDTQENRLFISQFYTSVTLKIIDLPTILEQTFTQLFQQFPEELRPSQEQTDKLIEKAIPSIKKHAVEVQAKMYNLCELRELAKFYSTPTGYSIMKKSGPAMLEIQKVMSEEMEKITKEIMEQ